MHRVLIAVYVCLASFSLCAQDLTGLRYLTQDKQNVLSFFGTHAVYVKTHSPFISGRNCLYWGRKFEKNDKKIFKSEKDHKFKHIITISCSDGLTKDLALTESFFIIKDQAGTSYWKFDTDK